MSDYSLRCSDQEAMPLYQAMLRDGLKPEAIDQGVLAGVSKGEGVPVRETKGAGDRVITCEELHEAAARHAEKYQDYLTTLTGRRVPWLLEDPTARGKNRKAIDLIQARLSQQGIRPGSTNYRRRLAAALYIYAMSPEKPPPIPKEGLDIIMRLRLFDTLEPMGLRPLQEFLLKEGGLGLLEFPDDAPFEATATEALRQRRGACTERSKILYALFSQAGLKPFFVFMTAGEVHQAWAKEFGLQGRPPVTPRDYLEGHMAVGIQQEGGRYFFEPNLFYRGEMFEPFAVTLSLRELYQFDLFNLAGEQMNAGDWKNAQAAVEGGMALGHSYAYDWLVLRQTKRLLHEQKKGEALDFLLEVTQRRPDMAQNQLQVCDLFFSVNQCRQAAACYETLPEDLTPREIGLGHAHFCMGEWEEARRHFEKAVLLGADPAEVYLHVGTTVEHEGEPADAEQYFRRVISAPSGPAGYYHLGNLLGRLGRHREAVEIFKQGIALHDEPALYCGLAEALVTLGRTREARAYFQRAALFLRQSPGLFSINLLVSWRRVMAKAGVTPFLRRTVNQMAQRAGSYPFWQLLQLELDAAALSRQPLSERKERWEQVIAAFSRQPALHHTIYWHLFEVAEKLKHLPMVLEWTRSVSFPHFRVYALHAAWKLGQPEEIQRELEQWDRTIGFLRPENVEINVFSSLREAMDKCPEEMWRAPAYRVRLARYYRVLGEGLRLHERETEARRALAKAEALEK